MAGPYTWAMTNLKLAHVLVVDDDPDLRQLLGTYLSSQGLRVSLAEDASSMREVLAQGVPDAMVLDLMLPGEDGLSITRQVKAVYPLPILMLSARGEEMDRIIGLEVGVDDYLAKPFSPRELLARLRALMRRHPLEPQPSAVESVSDPVSATLAFGPFVLDVAARSLRQNGVELSLTTAEFELLEVLVARPGRVLSRDGLMDLLKGYERGPFDRSIDNRVTRLRRKIELDPSSPRYIRTVRGVGYLFNPKGDAA